MTAEKILNDKKILLILICRSEAELQRQMKFLKDSRLRVPSDDEDWSFDIAAAAKNKSLAASLNNIQADSDAKYKIFISAPAVYIDPQIIKNTIKSFLIDRNVAMVGLIGSEMPIDGDFSKAKSVYGLYSFLDGEVKKYLGKEALYFKATHILDGSFFATCEDLDWDENVGEDFLVAAQCLNFRAKGYQIGVVYQETPWITFAGDYYNSRAQDYSEQLEHFRNLYLEKIQPLVSVLIPAYNQPKFLEETLQSVLNQTYKNIEILIGDDSTNEDVKEMIQPYLEKYSQIKYFYHGGPLGNRGGKNNFFLLNHCGGEFVNYLLHDDLFYPEKISRMMEFFVRDLDGKIGLVTSARDLIDADSKVIKRKNPWQPHRDRTFSGEEVGRQIFFTLANFLGEMSTVLFRKNLLKFRDAETGAEIYSTGCFCGIAGSVYGDLDAWLNILRQGVECVFIAETLSAFRRHEAQNTYNPYVRTKLPLDMLHFITIAWLNNIFLHSVDEYKYCVSKWILMAEMWQEPATDETSDEIKNLKNHIARTIEIAKTGDSAKILDAIISYMLEHLPENNSIRALVRKNSAGLWEKAGDGIFSRARLE